MKSLLFALGLALCCLVQANQDKRPKDVDLSVMNGPWIGLVMATDCQKIKEMVSHMKASPISFEQKSADEVKMTFVMDTPGGCKTMRPVLQRENGVLTTTCGKGGKKTVERLNIDGNSMLALISISHQKGQCKMAKLLVRNLSDYNDELKNKFRDFADRNGLEGHEIHVLSTEGMCPLSS